MESDPEKADPDSEPEPPSDSEEPEALDDPPPEGDEEGATEGDEEGATGDDEAEIQEYCEEWDVPQPQHTGHPIPRRWDRERRFPHEL